MQSLRSLRAIVLGGEPGDKELLSKCLDLKLNIFISYGMTETCSGISGFWLHEHPDKIQSAGKAFKGVDISQNNGYIAIKSPMNMKQYFCGTIDFQFMLAMHIILNKDSKFKMVRHPLCT